MLLQQCLFPCKFPLASSRSQLVVSQMSPCMEGAKVSISADMNLWRICKTFLSQIAVFIAASTPVLVPPSLAVNKELSFSACCLENTCSWELGADNAGKSLMMLRISKSPLACVILNAITPEHWKYSTLNPSTFEPCQSSTVCISRII